MTDADARPTPMTEDARTARVSQMHVIVNEIRRCIGDDQFMQAYRKLDYLDGLICDSGVELDRLWAELEAAQQERSGPLAQGDGDPAGDEPPVEDQAP